MSRARVLETPHPPGDILSVGDTVRFDGHTYTVTVLQGPRASLEPREEGVDAVTGLLPALVAAGDFAVLDRLGRPQPRPQLLYRNGEFDALPAHVRAQALEWERHVKQVLHQQMPNVPTSAVPLPEYDPALRTLQERYEAKARQLRALGRDVSAATVERKCRSWRAHGVMGLVDGRSTRGSSPYGRTDPRVVELLWEVMDAEAEAEESAGTAQRLWERLESAVARRYRRELDDPLERARLRVPRSTFYKLLQRLGITVDDVTGTLVRRTVDLGRPKPPYTPTVARVPGELVQIDTTGLDILAIGDDGRPTPVEATIEIDIATRSIIGEMIVPKQPGDGPRGARVGGRATRALDAVFTIAQALAPVPGKPGWSPLTLMDGSDLPYEELLAADPRMEGAAARPVIRPQTVVIDHGRVFTGSVFSSACAELGIEVRHARTRTPTDKAIVERAMRTIKTKFSQYVAGHTARRLELRGRHVDKQPLWTINQLQDMLSEWIALQWQQTPQGGLRSPYTPGLVLSPNQMYAAAVSLTGYRALPQTPGDNRKLLPAQWVTVTRKGFQINNRTYSLGDELVPFRRPSGIPGRRGKWEAHYNPYEPGVAWLYDHRAEEGQDPWVEVPFVFRRLIDDPWTERVWEQATAAHIAAGGSVRDERAIARAINELRERARRGHAPARTVVPPPFQGRKLETATQRPDPLENLPAIDPATITPYRSLDVPAADLFVDPRPPQVPRPPADDVLAALDWDIGDLDGLPPYDPEGPGPDGGTEGR
ncbi:transposase [Kitasatospora xanthocidica]|uniref:Transposase n=1 Tax=Kitasatospora xanthocidica TaxID=83382 RepID=A0A372ZKR2_9ACTN|nr:DDE-type integrase/transposase/recombinase [Kitasatospora xanthocidica]RGD56406.1 transposase [Kitasatospora xanthocidica]